MKRWVFDRRLILFLLSAPFFSLFPQSDSVQFVTAPWKSVRVCKGITWKSYQFRGNLFNSNQSINIVEVKKNKKLRFSLANEVKQLRATSDFGKSELALVALNGTFFDVKEGGSVDFMKVKNSIVNDNKLVNGNRAIHQKSGVTIRNGKLEIAQWDGTDRWEYNLEANEIMVTGPLLVYRSRMLEIDSTAFTVTRHPRTLVAQDTKKIYFVTIDGRNENASGMNISELQKMARWMACQSAINLDGGGSTTLWIYNQPDNGVVNYPSDNKSWDHWGERKVANVILIKGR